MSVPPVNYSVPPPQLNMPPPRLAQIITPAVPPPHPYNHPPPPLPPAPSVSHSSVPLPLLNRPPPTLISYPPPMDVHVPPFPPPVPTNYRFKNAITTTETTHSQLNTVNVEKSLLRSNRLNPREEKNISKAILSYKARDKSDSERSKDFNQSDAVKSTEFNKSDSKSVSNTEKLHHQHLVTKRSVSTLRSKYSPQRDRERTYVTEKNHDYEKRYSEERRKRHEKERSPSTSSSRSSYRTGSLSRSSLRDKDRERYDKERYEYERERYEYERKRYEYEHRHSSSHRSSSSYRSHRSHSRSYDSHAEKRRNRSVERQSCYSPGREVHRRGHTQDHSPHSTSHKPMTDREKILVEYSKNYCRTPEDYIEKMQRWTEKEKLDGEAPKVWYRNSPAELYYNTIEGGDRVEQTSKLEKLCNIFYKNLIERGINARPEIDELPPLKAPKAKMCKHRLDEKSSSSSSSESDEYLDKDGLQGYTDRIMLELQRKQSHPKRLHPEMWYNNTGEMNSGPLCRCSAKARRQGMRHGIYAGEESFPKCIPTQNNLNKLYHYHITVSPPTNFLIKAPTMIHHDEHEFLFAGFSMFSHYKLAKLPNCKVIRFNIEYTILYIEEAAPKNFTVQELDLFENYLFTELLELIDLDLGKATENSCSQFHFMPRFVRNLPEGGCEVLSMCEVLKYLVEESGLLIPPDMLEKFHNMDNYSWQKFVDRVKGMIVTYPGKKPCSVRVDQLDRSPPVNVKDGKVSKDRKSFYPEIVHFGMRPPLLSYAGNPEYQKAWRYYVKYRHLIANMAKPTYRERQKLAAKEAKLQEMRTQSKMKRDVTVVISSEGFHTTGLMCDVVQHAMLIPVLVRHLRFHKSLDSLEAKIGYVFKQRALLQTALTHPSYRENFGTNPDHARNSLTNCGIRQPQYGDRRIHYTRKKGIVTLINIMSRPGKSNETESEIKHYERLEFLGDAVVEFLSSIHLFRMFPGLAEGGLATYRASVVQNQHLAQLAKNISLEQYMLYAHGSDLCQDVVMRHAMANCFEALMGALFLDAGLEVADRVFALALWHGEPQLLEVWVKERPHPLQEQEPLGDRQYIKDFEFLEKLTKFEESIGVTFKHIRLLARAFTDRSVGFTHLTLGSNQRLEFLGDTVLQLVVSDRLYRHFPEHHEGHLSLLRSSLVNNRTQSLVCDDLDMSSYAIYNNPKAKPTTKKHKADLLEAFLGALYIDKGLEYCQAFCNACLFPRLQEFIINQDWNDPKSKLQQCCLTLRSMEGGEPDIPLYKVIECLGPTNTRVYTVGVYFRGTRLAAARGHSIQEAEMNAAEQALSCAHELFPQLDHQKRIIAKSLKKKKNRQPGGADDLPPHLARAASLKRKSLEEKVPKAYRLDKKTDSSDESSAPVASESEDEAQSQDESKSEGDSGLDSESESISLNKLEDVKVSSLVSDMEKIKEDFIRRNEYDKLKEKCRKSDSDDD